MKYKFVKDLFKSTTRKFKGLGKWFGLSRVGKFSWWKRNKTILAAVGTSTVGTALGSWIYQKLNETDVISNDVGSSETGFSQEAAERTSYNERQRAISEAISALRSLSSNTVSNYNTKQQAEVIKLFSNLVVVVNNTDDEEVRGTMLKCSRYLSAQTQFGLIPTTFDEPASLLPTFGGVDDVTHYDIEDALIRIVDLQSAGLDLTSVYK